MRITQMNLADFGIYHQVRWNPPEKGLIVMHGQNESGKTTLMKYVRSMFFGYPPGEESDYSAGMTIRREDGKDYQIIRQGKAYYLTNGWDKTEEEPANLWWHGLDQQAYDKIFAMGLEDLQGFTILSNEAVRSHFFRVEGGTGMERARREVNQQLAALLQPSPQGKKPINLLVNEQKDFERRIHGMAYDEEEFAKLQKEEQESHAVENRIRLDIEDSKQQIERVSLPIAAWDVYLRGQDAVQQMQKLADVSQFPADGAARWKELEDKINTLEEQMRSLRSLNRKEPAFQDKWNRWLKAAPHLDEMYHHLGEWKQAAGEIENHDEARLQEQRKQQTQALQQWTNGQEVPQNVDWTGGLSRVQDLDKSRQELEKWQASEPQEVTLPAETAEKDERTPEEWAEINAAAGKMRQLISQRQKIKEQQEWLRRAPFDSVKGIPVPSIAFVIAAAVCLLAVYGGNFNAVAGWLGALLCLGAAGYFFWRQQHQDEQMPREMDELVSRLSEIDEQINELAYQSASFGLRGQDTDEEWQRALDDLQQQYQDWQAQKSREAWLTEQQEKYRSLQEKWEREGKAYKQQQETRQKAWEDWRSKAGFPSLRAEAVSQAKEAWDTWKRLLDSSANWQKRRAELDEKIQQLQTQAAGIFKEVGETKPASLENAEAVYQKWQDIRVKAEVAREQDRQQEERETQIARLEKEKEQQEIQQKKLLSLAGVETEAEFRSKVLRYRQFQQYKEVYDQTEAHLRLIAKTPKLLSELQRELKTHTLKTWQDERDYYQRKIDDAEKNLAGVVEKRGSIVERLSQMAKSDEYSKLLQQREIRLTKLDQDADAWLAYLYTQYMLEKAQEYYEQVRQPQVIQAASTYLSRMTNGRYTLQASVDGKQLYAIDGSQRRLPEKQWSSGLGDQIYLAIRLSLAMSFASQIEPMPLILDDILVRFDEQRQKEALQFLAFLGKDQQIFLFTCSEATNKIAKAVQKELAGETDTIHLYEIEKGTIRAQSEAKEA